VKFVENLAILDSIVLRPINISTLSTMTTDFIVKIKDGISAPILKLIILILIIHSTQITKVMVILSLKILFIVNEE